MKCLRSLVEDKGCKSYELQGKSGSIFKQVINEAENNGAC